MIHKSQPHRPTWSRISNSWKNVRTFHFHSACSHAVGRLKRKDWCVRGSNASPKSSKLMSSSRCRRRWELSLRRSSRSLRDSCWTIRVVSFSNHLSKNKETHMSTSTTKSCPWTPTLMCFSKVLRENQDRRSNPKDCVGWGKKMNLFVISSKIGERANTIEGQCLIWCQKLPILGISNKSKWRDHNQSDRNSTRRKLLGNR